MQLHKNIFLTVVISLILLSGQTYSQLRISSPYTFYGVGELQTNRFGRNMAMGGISTAYRDSKGINMSNPASYSSFDTSHFLFEVGVTSNFSQLKTSKQTQKYTNHTSLGYILLGSPITKWCFFSIGAKPFSETGYRVTASDTVQNIGNVSMIYDGSGGVYQVYAGTAFKFLKRFSVGVNLSYLFGTTHKNRTVYFPGSYTFNTKVLNSYTVSDIMFNYGLQYFQKIKEKYEICAGLTFSLPTKLKAERDYLAERFTSSSAGIEVIQDTVEYKFKEKGYVEFPLIIGGGLTFKKGQNWMFGADITYGNWKQFKNFGLSDSLNDNLQISIGGQITPKYNAVSNYLKRVTYRFGFRYNDTYLGLRGNNLKEYGISFGFGFPIAKSKSNINLAFELGKMGTTNASLVQNNFGRVTLGISIKEEWFFKRKLE